MIDSLAIWDTWKTEPYVPALQMAALQSELGTREVGNNCQKFSYLQSGVRCQDGGWCVSFASCGLAAGGFPWGREDLKPWRQQFPGRGFASTALLVQWGEELGIAHDPWNYTARPGDLICVRNWAHTSTNVDDTRASTLITIDGNTSNMVAYRERYRSTVGKIIAVTAFADVAPPTRAQIKAQQPTLGGESVPIMVKEKLTNGQPNGEWVTAEVVNGVLFVTGQKTNPFVEGHQGDMAPWPADKTGTTFVCDLKPFMPDGTVLRGFPATEHAPDGPGSWVLMSSEPIGGGKYIVRKKVLHRR